MCSNNLQNFTNFSGLEYYGSIPPINNQNNSEQKTNQFNNLTPSTTKNSMNMLTFLNNIMLNSSKKLQKNVTSNLNNDFQTSNKLNSNLQVQQNTNKIDCLNFSMNNILNKISPPKQKKLPKYTNYECSVDNCNITVPYFDTELYNKVNFNSTWSEKIDGSDLPYNDVTTLRFFYNFGVNQFKECQVKDNKCMKKTNLNYSTSSKTSNLTNINNAPIFDNLNLLPTIESQSTIQKCQQVYPIIENQKQHLSEFNDQKINKTSSIDVTKESFNNNTLSEDQTMPYLEPQVYTSSNNTSKSINKDIFFENSVNCYQTNHNSNNIPKGKNNLNNNKHLTTGIDESISKTFNVTSSVQSNFSTFPSTTNMMEEHSFDSSLVCNNMSMKFNIIADNEKSNYTYSKMIPIVVTKKVVCFINSISDKTKSTTNMITLKDNLRMIKNYNENQITIENNVNNNNEYKFQQINTNKFTTNHNEDKIPPKKDNFNTFLQSITSKTIKRPREAISSQNDFENTNSIDDKNSLLLEKNLESSPLKRSKMVDVNINSALARCIKKLNTINNSNNFNEDNLENFNVIISSIEPKLLQSLETLTLSYCDGKHYIIEKHNNSLQKEIDKIVRQELYKETPTGEESSNLQSDIENYYEYNDDHKFDVTEDNNNKVIRYIIKTPDNNNILKQDIENISMEEKKKFEADVIQEALDKHLIKPVTIKKSSVKKINIKAYVAMPFFNNYLHYITNEYLNQIENDSNNQIINQKICPASNKSPKEDNLLQCQVSKLKNKDSFSIVPMPIRGVSLDKTIYEVSIKTIQNKKLKNINKFLDSTTNISNISKSFNNNNLSFHFSQNLSNLSTNSQKISENMKHNKTLPELSFNYLFNNFQNQQFLEQIKNSKFMGHQTLINSIKR